MAMTEGQEFSERDKGRQPVTKKPSNGGRSMVEALLFGDNIMGSKTLPPPLEKKNPLPSS